MTILGIDPGVTGAIAHFGNGKLYDVRDIPFIKGGAPKEKKRIDLLGLREYFLMFAGDLNITVYLEKAQAMPWSMHKRNQGVASTFAYGKTFGLIIGVLAGLGIFNVKLVVPAKWKRHLHLLGNGLPKTADLERARKLYPQAPLNLQKHHNRADAILIGHYGCMMEGVL